MPDAAAKPYVIAAARLDSWYSSLRAQSRFDQTSRGWRPPGMRRDMVRMLNEQLLDRGIRDPNVLRAMANVPRHRFVPDDVSDQAYADRALPIACGQTISQPYIVGLMTQALALRGTEKVLEIGTGSGYQTAILSRLAQSVITLERHPDLSHAARQLLSELGCENVSFVIGDGTLGWLAEAPYDRILVAAASPSCPAPLLDQLADDGVLVIPIGAADDQVLRRIHKRGPQFETEELTHCRFVPLVAG